MAQEEAIIRIEVLDEDSATNHLAQVNKSIEENTKLRKANKKEIEFLESLGKKESARVKELRKENAALDVVIKEQGKTRRRQTAFIEAERAASNQLLGQKQRLRAELARETQILNNMPNLYRKNAKGQLELTKEGEKQTKVVRGLKNDLLQLDNQINDGRSSVGLYAKGWSSVGNMLKRAAAGLVAYLGIQEGLRRAVTFLKDATAAYREQEKAVTKVRQALISTEGASKKSLKGLINDAKELQKTSLFGDEVILNDVTAQLLTFTNIAQDEFDRVQQVALDVATVLDKDLKSTSIQLGKALNDPVRQLSALQESGIQFTKEQTELIKSLAETNRLAEAQGVILSELERQYGGQAAAAVEADKGVTQLSNTWGDFKEVIGEAIFSRFGDNIERWAITVERWTKALEPATSEQEQFRIETERTRVELDRELDVLQDSNLSNDARSKLIKEINEKYKEYLPRLITEKDSLQDIKEIQDEVNKGLKEKIIISGLEEELTQALKDQVAAQKSLVNIEIQRAKLKTDERRGINEDNAALAEFNRNQLNLAQNFNEKLVDNTDKRTTEIKDKYKQLADSIGLEFDKILAAASGVDGGTGTVNTTAEVQATQAIEDLKSSILEDGIATRQQLLEAEQVARREGFEQESGDIEALAQLRALKFQEELKNTTDITEAFKLRTEEAGQLYRQELSDLKDALAEKEITQAEYDLRSYEAYLAWTESLNQVDADRLAYQKQVAQASEDIARSYLSSITSILRIFSDNQDQLNVFAKATALFEIGVNAAKGISAIVGKPSPAALLGGPFAVAAERAINIAGVLKAVADAKRLLTEPPSGPAIRGFHSGGPATMGFGEAMQLTGGRTVEGKVGGHIRQPSFVVSERQSEWISPGWMNADPISGPIIAQLEQYRASHGRSMLAFNDGGFADRFRPQQSESPNVSEMVEAVLNNVTIVTDVKDVIREADQLTEVQNAAKL